MDETNGLIDINFHIDDLITSSIKAPNGAFGQAQLYLRFRNTTTIVLESFVSYLTLNISFLEYVVHFDFIISHLYAHRITIMPFLGFISLIC